MIQKPCVGLMSRGTVQMNRLIRAIFEILVLSSIVLSVCTGPLARAQEPAQLTERAAYREYGYVPMKDGVRLAYILWRPQKEGRYPTLFMTTTV
jgi:hypothetical protein